MKKSIADAFKCVTDETENYEDAVSAMLSADRAAEMARAYVAQSLAKVAAAAKDYADALAGQINQSNNI